MMRSFSIVIVIVGCLCSLIALSACDPDNQEEMLPGDAAEITVQEITQFIGAYDTAWLDKDIARLADLQDPNYVYFSSRGAVLGAQYVLDLVGHPTYRTENMSRTEIAPYIHGSIAIVGTRWTATPYYKGKRYDDDQRCVLVISKESDSLRLLSEHCTQITA